MQGNFPLSHLKALLPMKEEEGRIFALMIRFVEVCDSKTNLVLLALVASPIPTQHKHTQNFAPLTATKNQIQI